MLKFFFSQVIGWDPKNLTYIYDSDYYTANSLTLSERLALCMHASFLVLVLATHLHGLPPLSTRFSFNYLLLPLMIGKTH